MDPDPECLHCAINELIMGHREREDWRNSGYLLAKLVETMGDILASIKEDQGEEVYDSGVAGIYAKLADTVDEIDRDEYKKGGTMVTPQEH